MRQGNLSSEAHTIARYGFDGQGPSRQADTFLHADEAEALAPCQFRIEAPAGIPDLEPQGRGAGAQRHLRLRRAGMFGDVPQRLLDDAVDAKGNVGWYVGGQPPRRKLDLDRLVLGKVRAISLEGLFQHDELAGGEM